MTKDAPGRGRTQEAAAPSEVAPYDTKMRIVGVALSLVAATPTLAQEAGTSGPEGAPVAAPAAPGRPALPPPPPPPAGASGETTYGKGEGFLPGMVIGPKLAILSLPAPALGIEAKIDNVLGLSFDYGFIPDVTIDDVTAGYRDWNFAARWYPWQRAFYIGAALGRRSFEASKRDDATGLKASVDVASTYLAPELGWRWVWNSGFFLGMDLGYQIILSSKTTLDIPAGIAGSTTAADVRDTADDVGEIGLPIVSLLQVGYFF